MSKFNKIVAYSLIADIGYPSTICSSIFVKDCNFRCPYCINRRIVVGDLPTLDTTDLLNFFLLRREKMLVVSGGEPFIYDNIYDLFEEIKERNMEVAVATNGSYPDKLKKSFSEKLVDYAILDIKTSLDVDKYSKVSGRQLCIKDVNNIKESIDFLKTECKNIKCEFRTTVCTKFVNKEDIFSIANYIGMGNIYFLQPFLSHQTLDPNLSHEYCLSYETIREWAKELDNNIVSGCFVREV